MATYVVVDPNLVQQYPNLGYVFLSQKRYEAEGFAREATYAERGSCMALLGGNRRGVWGVIDLSVWTQAMLDLGRQSAKNEMARVTNANDALAEEKKSLQARLDAMTRERDTWRDSVSGDQNSVGKKVRYNGVLAQSDGRAEYVTLHFDVSDAATIVGKSGQGGTITWRAEDPLRVGDVVEIVGESSLKGQRLPVERVMGYGVNVGGQFFNPIAVRLHQRREQTDGACLVDVNQPFSFSTRMDNVSVIGRVGPDGKPAWFVEGLRS